MLSSISRVSEKLQDRRKKRAYKSNAYSKSTTRWNILFTSRCAVMLYAAYNYKYYEYHLRPVGTSIGGGGTKKERKKKRSTEG